MLFKKTSLIACSELFDRIKFVTHSLRIFSVETIENWRESSWDQVCTADLDFWFDLYAFVSSINFKDMRSLHLEKINSCTHFTASLIDTTVLSSFLKFKLIESPDNVLGKKKTVCVINTYLNIGPQTVYVRS